MKTLTFSLAMALSLALVTSAGAQDKCGALKMKASGKKAAGLATCYAKGLAHGDLSFVPTCTAAVSLKFGVAFDKAEAKFGPACLTHDDKGDIEDAIDTCTTTIFDALRHMCGDGVVQGSEACDDGDITNGDGCSGVCTIEHGFYCDNSPPPSVCASQCGDGLVASNEGCDDGNTTDGDGCSATCAIEAGYACCGEPSGCLVPSCGDAIVTCGEGCDDGNTLSGDGCDATCSVEHGYGCIGSPSACATTCGDGLIGGAEGCDDGNTADGDGCSATCQVEAGFSCAGEPSVCM